MEKEDIMKASLKYKRKIEGMEGNFYNNISLESVARAFREGASWRINSVWHDAKTDVPEAHFPVLVEDYLGDSEVSMLAPKEECPKNWVRWAYIGDLLPKEED